MIPKQQRIDAYSALSRQVSWIIQQARNAKLKEIETRIMPLKTDFFLVEPRRDSNDTIWFDSIWQSSANCTVRNLKIHMFFTDDLEMNAAKGGVYLFRPSEKACYQRNLHMIILKMDADETMRYMAWCLVHELGHAQLALEKRLDSTNVPYGTDEEDQEEALMRTFDYKLMLAMGDGQLRGPAQEFSRKIMLLRTGQQKKPPPRKGIGKHFDNILGAPNSEEAENSRDNLFTDLCEMMAIDSRISNEHHAFEEKCRFFKRLRTKRDAK